MQNPFTVHSPETLSPEQIAALFENVFADIPSVKQTGHTFIHGPRGSGKSMMFRYLLPEVQQEVARLEGKPYSLQDLEQYAIHFPIKSLPNFDFGKADSARHTILGDHYLAIRATRLILESLDTLHGTFSIPGYAEHIGDFQQFFNELSDDYGISVDLASRDVGKPPLAQMQRVIAREVSSVERYVRNISVSSSGDPYRLGVTTFIDYVVPILKELKKFTTSHFFLMIDDADELDSELQKILNTWVSKRTTDVVSLKISTQLRYATYQTLSGSIVESPHDFKAVDLSQIYTSKVDHYFDQVYKIVEKRLEYYRFTQSPEEFFPEDQKQIRGIEKEKQAIREKHAKGQGVSSRLNDDIYRYAVPNYIASLREGKKSNRFSYSGFKTLVNLSSGIIRLFLEPASQMYSKCESMQDGSTPIHVIPPSLQNDLVREWSEAFYTEELPRIPATPEEIGKLKNLIKGLGDLFTNMLLNEGATERRVFSVFMDEPPEDVGRIIDLGVSYGYFQKSSIRSKERTGRKLEIIFNRRLAPYFSLDPTGYSGRLSIQIAHLRIAMEDPSKFVKLRLKLDENEGAENQQFLFE